MVVEGVLNRFAVVERLENFKFLVSQRGINFLGHVEAPQRPNPVDAIRPAHFFIVGEFEVGPIFNMLFDVIQVVATIELFQLLASKIDQAAVAII